MRHAGYGLIVIAMSLGFLAGLLTDPFITFMLGMAATVFGIIGVTFSFAGDHEAMEEWSKIIGKSKEKDPDA